MTTVVFLRHGPTRENQEGRVQGQQPGQLLVRETEAYISAITPMLRATNPSVLVSSDLGRATGTRQILKDFLQLPTVTEVTLSLLRERAVGTYEGKLWTDMPAALQSQRGRNEYDFRVCGGEDNQAVAARVAATLRYLASAHAHASICCISHACWLQQLAQMITAEVLPDDWFDRTAIYELELAPAGTITNFKVHHIAAKLPRDLG